jgi:hypothetical protein
MDGTGALRGAGPEISYTRTLLRPTTMHMQISSSHLPLLPLSGRPGSPAERRDLTSAEQQARPASVPATHTLEGELLNGRRGVSLQSADPQRQPPLESGEKRGDQQLPMTARRALSAYQGYARQEASEYLQATLGIDVYV